MNVAILGAGLGGLGTTIALKLKGLDVEVYERHAGRSDIGAGIMCWPNASFILSELGVLDEVAYLSGRPEQMQRLTFQGDDLGSLDLVELNRQMGYPSFSSYRKDLMRVLELRAIKLGVKINYNHSVRKIIPSQSRLSKIQFVNGSAVQADLVVGADGRMNSVARAFVNGDNTPIYQGFVNWIGTFRSERPLFDEMVIRDYWGTGERFGIVPLSPYKAYWAGAVAATEILGKNPVTYHAELLSIFKEWPVPILKIIMETQIDQINKVYVHDHNPINIWHKGNVLLVGDAAHAPLPTSGQGACQALEDGWHLASLLKINGPNLEKTFQEYTKIRFSKTSEITLAARQLASSLFNTDPAYCHQRNIRSINTDYREVVNGMSKGWASGLPIGPFAPHSDGPH